MKSRKSLASDGDFGGSNKGKSEGSPDLFNQQDINGEGAKDEAEEPDHRYLGNVEEAIDRRAELHKPQ
jgi:hypothetical protein